jgi:hypothetical protein
MPRSVHGQNVNEPPSSSVQPRLGCARQPRETSAGGGCTIKIRNSKRINMLHQHYDGMQNTSRAHIRDADQPARAVNQSYSTGSWATCWCGRQIAF